MNTFSKMSQQSKYSECPECPICMENIFTINCITTECGHRFHASCLMENISYRGFDCPYCRTKMVQNEHEHENAPEPEYENEYIPDQQDYYDDDYYINENNFRRVYNIQEPSDNTLRAFRFFTNRIYDEANEEIDDYDEEVMIQETDTTPIEEYNDLPKDAPTIEIILEKLRENGINTKDLLIALLENHREYSDKESVYKRSCQVYGQMRRIIIKHTREYYNTHPIIENAEPIIENA